MSTTEKADAIIAAINALPVPSAPLKGHGNKRVRFGHIRTAIRRAVWNGIKNSPHAAEVAVGNADGDFSTNRGANNYIRVVSPEASEIIRAISQS